MTSEPNALPKLLERGTVTIGGYRYKALRDGREGAVFYYRDDGQRVQAQLQATRDSFEPEAKP